MQSTEAPPTPQPPTADPAEPTQPLLLWVVPVLLVIPIPGLWWLRASAPFAPRFELALTMTVFVLIFAAVVLAAMTRGYRTRLRWGLGITTTVIVVAFSWPALAHIGARVAEVTGLALLGDATPVFIAGTILWLANRLAADMYFPIGATVLAAVAVIVLCAATLSLTSRSPDSVVTHNANPGPDVLLLILDDYGRADWLGSEFDFDNDQFLTGLEERGFRVASAATANYAMTYASVSTMLNLDYVFDAGTITSDEWELMRAALTGRVGLLSTFDAAGYEVVYFENPWSGSLCGPTTDWCFREGLIERSLWNLSQLTVFAPLVRNVRPHPFNSVSLHHLDSLTEVIAQPSPGGIPRLTVAHLLLPHEPLVLDAECNRVDNGELERWAIDPENLPQRRNLYADQVRCVNKLVLRAIDSQIERDPNAVVMISADHGPPSALDLTVPVSKISRETIIERMTILSAYRLPGCPQPLRTDLTPVNGIRLATNCALGTSLAEVPDHNLWTDLSMTQPIVSVKTVVRDAG